MKTVHRIALRHVRRAGLFLAACGITPAMAQSPGRPVRLPPVSSEASTSDSPASGINAFGINSPSIDASETNTPASALTNQFPLRSAREVKARAAAMKSAEASAASSISEPQLRAASSRQWLPTTTAHARFDSARKHLSEASRSYDVGAWLTAEASAWESLRHAAEAIDLTRSEAGQPWDARSSASAQLQFAKQAIVEARDFQRWASPNDSSAITRTARSHRTSILQSADTTGLTASQAADRYLDSARVALSTLASESVEAAQAMDLLAATLLTRNEPRQLPSSTALCLRRAALQGQPQNASLAFRLGTQLAHIGLLAEAKWALEHAMSLDPNANTATMLATVLRRNGQNEQARQLMAAYQYPAAPPAKSTIAQATAGASNVQLPQITQLTPEQFASVSPSVMSGQTQATPASVIVAADPKSTEDESTEDKKPGAIRSFFGSLRSVW